jgi:hypothetical protein
MYEESPDSPWTDIIEQYLPIRYNEATELKADINGNREKLDFNLKSGS